MGVDLGGTKTTVIAASIAGRICSKRTWQTPEFDRYLDVGWVAQAVSQFASDLGLEPGGLKGLGIGVPGAVDTETGCAFLAPNLGWMEDYPVRSALEKALGVTVIVENDVNMAAIGERTYGSARDIDDFVFIAVGTGIGAGIVMGGELYRGAHWSAGEIGYMAFSRDCVHRSFRDFGFLELKVSGRGIESSAKRARDACAQGDIDHRQPIPLTSRREVSDAKSVFEAAQNGDPQAKRIVTEAIDYLTLAVASTVAILDPSMVVLGGGVLARGQLSTLIEKRIRGLVPTKTRVSMSSLGADAQAFGAIASAAKIAGVEITL
jgi:glucokinase